MRPVNRLLALLLALTAGLAPGAVAASVRSAVTLDVPCCCSSGEPTPQLRAEPVNCCCAPAPSLPAQSRAEISTPAPAPTVELAPAAIATPTRLPRVEPVAHTVPSFECSRAPPVRVRLGVWLL